jgi:hypothetical protein
MGCRPLLFLEAIMAQPIGSIVIAQNTNLAISPPTAAAQLTGWTGNGVYSTYDDGDQSVQPDYANSQILVHKPGIYEVTFSAQVQGDGEQPAEFDLYANGLALATPVGAQVTFSDSKIAQVAFGPVIYKALAPGSSGGSTDALTIYMLSDSYASLGVDLTLVSATFTVKRVA